MKQQYPKQPTNQHRINEAINVDEVLIITTEGDSKGPCSISQAIQMARDMGLDLVEVSPNAKPPVCKILDYGKFRYNQSKKQRGSVKKKQTLKEIRMQPKISDHDIKFKTNHVKSFLEEGNKVKVTIRFRGREFAHTELGAVTLNHLLELLTCPYTLDKPPTMEGRTMSMLLSPSTKKTSIKKVQAQNAETKVLETPHGPPQNNDSNTNNSTNTIDKDAHPSQ